MKHARGDIFTAHPPQVDAICITTNMQVKRNGLAVCGAGIALAAAKQWATFPVVLGILLKQNIKRVAIVLVADGDTPNVIAFPTKDDWRNPSSLKLIERGLKQLVEMTDLKGWKSVWLPSLGTNNGKLSKLEVWPLMSQYLDNRFTLVTRG